MVRLRALVEAEIAHERAQLARLGLPLPEPTPAGGDAGGPGHWVADLLGASLSDLRRHDRHWPLAQQRQLAAWLLRQEGLSFAAIGRALNRDHSTVLYAVRRVEANRDLLDQGAQLRTRVA